MKRWWWWWNGVCTCESLVRLRMSGSPGWQEANESLAHVTDSGAYSEWRGGDTADLYRLRPITAIGGPLPKASMRCAHGSNMTHRYMLRIVGAGSVIEPTSGHAESGLQKSQRARGVVVYYSRLFLYCFFTIALYCYLVLLLFTVALWHCSLIKWAHFMLQIDPTSIRLSPTARARHTCKEGSGESFGNFVVHNSASPLQTPCPPTPTLTK